VPARDWGHDLDAMARQLPGDPPGIYCQSEQSDRHLDRTPRRLERFLANGAGNVHRWCWMKPIPNTFETGDVPNGLDYLTPISNLLYPTFSKVMRLGCSACRLWAFWASRPDG